jgi:hypothetical protein
MALTEDVMTIRHSIEPWPIEWLIVSVVQRDHPEAAARWAIHNLVQSGMFNVSEDGEIDLSSADSLWGWWRDGTIDLEFKPAPTLPTETKPVEPRNKINGQPRMATLSDPSNHRSWHARSRARVAIGLLMTSPDLSMTFLGQDLLENDDASENGRYSNGPSTGDDGSQSDKAMQDHLRFTRDLVDLCGAQPAFRGNELHVYHAHHENRVIAFHRWLEGSGQDVVVVVSLNETTWWNYDLGFPFAGSWQEAFNSDVYENWINPWAAGNAGRIFASNVSMHGLPASAEIVIPANSILVFVPG